MKHDISNRNLAGDLSSTHWFFFFLIFLLTPIIATPQGENWRPFTHMPTPRHDAGCCVADGKIYVIGGMSHEYEGARTFLNLVTSYDPESETWDTCASLPETRVGAFACHMNGRIYLFGGCIDFHSLNSTTMYIYDIEKDEWTSGTEMPLGTSYAEGCIHDNKVYLIGGLESGTTNWAITNRVIRYDPAEDRWDTLANMNQARAHFSASVFDNKIYAIGGLDQIPQTLYDAVETYDPELDQWIIKNPAPTEICFHSSIAFNDRIWVMSGTPQATDTYIDSVYIYNPASDSWSTSVDADLPSVNFWDPQLLTHDEKVYLLCGSSGISFGDVSDVIEFDFPVARVQDDTVSAGDLFDVLFYEEGYVNVTPSGTPSGRMDIWAATILQETGMAGQTTSLQIDTPGSYWIYGEAHNGRHDRGFSPLTVTPSSVNTFDYENIPDFRFYPNPADDYLTVDLPFTGDICLLDQLARTVTEIPDVSGETTLSVSELPQGIYLLRVSKGKDFKVEKVMVE